MPIAKNRPSASRPRRNVSSSPRKAVDTRPKEMSRPAAAKASGKEVRIGMRLKHARLSKGYTLKELADIVECSESMISKVENDKIRPSIAMLHRFSQALETNIASLISEPDPNVGLVSIVRSGQRPRIHVDPEWQGEGVWLERLVPPSSGGLLQAHVLNLSPQGRS